MNKIDNLFQTKNHNLLDIYFCAGYPHLDSTVPTLLALQEQGIDMVEIGIPFSDPMADGPVIQTAATQALRHGMTLQLLFDQLKTTLGQIHIPVLLMGYLNVIYQYGFQHFCESCRDCGVDGVIIPDLPFDVYMKDYKETAEHYGIHVIMLMTPETSEERIRLIDANTHGFIYQVSTDATTGVQHSYNDATITYFKRVRNMHLQHPTLIGFGISNSTTLSAAREYAAGGIVGSLFVKLSATCTTPQEAVSALLDTLS